MSENRKEAQGDNFNIQFNIMEERSKSSHLES